MRRSFSRLGRFAIGLVLVVDTFVLMGGTTSIAASTAATTLISGTDALNVIWRGTTGDLAGSFGELFSLRKERTAACVISGYPAVTFYEHGRHLAMKVDAVPNLENETMGVTVGRRPQMVRLSASGGIASFWVFGNDNMSRCINASQMVITVRSLTGRAAVPAPSVYSLWPCCGDAVAVAPFVAGVSGSDPRCPLRSEILS
jgi:hypothetical protein